MYRDIEGYEGEYAISENGEVWSYKSNKIMKPLIDKDGYYKISLCKWGNYKQFFIHRLVALAFIPNPLNKPSVDHLDGNIVNNHVNNLAWATYSEQNSNPHWINARCKPIICIETGQIFKGITDAGKTLHLNIGHLSECVHGKRNMCGGYHWQYYKADSN